MNDKPNKEPRKYLDIERGIKGKRGEGREKAL
jgi:hypothetical protein